MRNAHKDIITNLFHHTLGPMMGWNTRYPDNHHVNYYYLDKNSFGYTILMVTPHGQISNISGTPKSARELIAWMDGVVYFIQHPQLSMPFREDVVKKLLDRHTIQQSPIKTQSMEKDNG